MPERKSLRSSPERHYEVGKGKPPMHTRFEKGQPSANPRGRPRKLSLEEQAKRELKKLLEEKVTIREGHRTMKVTALEAYVRRLRAKALSTGCIKAGREWLGLSIKHGALFSQPDTTELLTAQHKTIVERFLARARGEEPPVYEETEAPENKQGNDAADQDTRKDAG